MINKIAFGAGATLKNDMLAKTLNSQETQDYLRVLYVRTLYGQKFKGTEKITDNSVHYTYKKTGQKIDIFTNKSGEIIKQIKVTGDEEKTYILPNSKQEQKAAAVVFDLLQNNTAITTKQPPKKKKWWLF